MTPREAALKNAIAALKKWSREEITKSPTCRDCKASSDQASTQTIELEPEQFEHVRADFLLRLAKRRALNHDQFGNVLCRDAFKRMAHQEMRQRFRYPKTDVQRLEGMPKGVACDWQARP